jgi:GNAT superfamily N-acetyltransferase
MSIALHVMPMDLEGREELRLSIVLDDAMIGVASVVGVGKSVATIYQLFVVPEHRRKGMGMALVERVESEAKAWGATAVSAIVLEDGPVAWWRARGYDAVHAQMGQLIVSRRLKG